MAESLATGALHAGGNPDERFYAALGIATDGGFAGQHQAVGLFIGGVHHIGDLRAGGRGVGDHRFEKLGGHDHAFAEFMATLDDAALKQGKLLEFNLGAQVATGDHDDIGLADDRVDIADRFLVLDLGDELRVTFQGYHGITQLTNVGGIADKRPGDVVRLALDCESQILVVFFS
jgi:hypothetical protein